MPELSSRAARGIRRRALAAAVTAAAPLFTSVPSAHADDDSQSSSATASISAPASIETGDATPPAEAPPRPTAQPIRILKPEVPPGPRRIGLQAGHWQIADVPDELRRIAVQTGTSWGAVTEWQLNLDTANRVAAILRRDGYAVDVLPATIPDGYLADAFLAIHADGDPAAQAHGFKAAHGARRGPYEDRLVRCIVEEYGHTTGLPVDPNVTRNMLGYYAFAWSRFQASVAPHTPAAILETGFLTSAIDRAVLLGQPDLVASAIARGLLRFLDEVPAGAAFAEDLIIPPLPPRPPGAPPFTPNGANPGAPPPNRPRA